ncbi:MAG TPA: EscU/YscU/HrcU family type III secretion system export apparatus switch protein [Paenalcaligenes hominis]|uniref:EscU/YscU/HrcU family type III secretion system export apparatus switch protein n=1 Tax=Paenalcaligenes hominis TaxID=643674 RepID=A0A9D3AAK8_9BURK|nr:EscU/YscU/HrcU family type III secretion system export apparatus switch protein [Paenalcaligenes hominis]NJB65947.1 flagellar biosynthesis protein [Paenalcaligenes hominis]GGE70947.1 flagellar biosynthesis protein FlhB [Paenalcaligenes hominis]HJH24288.1 EscU/YscU/HrcU family type III secretion system export apparatus switch protein [Paenalcaligenes hominis]
MSTTKPPQHAVALRYDPSLDQAPRVVAKGYGHVADAIIATAHEHGLYVHESRELVGLLMQLDLDQHIPPELYLVIAELLAWLYALESGDAELDPLLGSTPPSLDPSPTVKK